MDGLESLINANPLPDDAPSAAGDRNPGLVIGMLIGFVPEEHAPLVILPGLPATAIKANAVVDLHGSHIGRRVAVMFEDSDRHKPVVMGVIRGIDGRPPLDPSALLVEVDADGGRMIVSAREQLVLRCGRASITLTRAGKVIIDGAYVSHRSTGVMRIKGGSVQLN